MEYGLEKRPENEKGRVQNCRLCLDQEDGLLFNGRRQSRDRVVTEKILSMTEGKPLWMSAYSRRIFPEDAPVCVAEELVGKLAEPARKDAEQVESAQEELEREEAAQKEPLAAAGRSGLLPDRRSS